MVKQITKSLAFLMLMGSLVLPFAGCFESETENKAEDVGEAIEQKAEDASDAMEESAEEAGEAVEEATE